MRFKISIAIVLFTIGSLAAIGQDQTKIPAGISLAIKAGNATELSKFYS
jgi:hypothetical protein